MSDRKSFSQYYLTPLLPKSTFGNLSKMKAQIVKMNLTNVFKTYKMRIFQNYMCSISFIYLIITIVHSVVLYTSLKLNEFNFQILIYLCSGGFVFIAITFYLRLPWIKSSPICAYILAWMVILIMLLSDISSCIYIWHFQNVIIRPSYADLVISSVYLFMPIFNRIHILLLGIFSTILYFFAYINAALYEDADDNVVLHYHLLIPDFLFIICLNILGLYINWQREIILHTIFLTKRESLEQTIILKYAKDQEKALLVSIIPPTIARKIGQEIKDRIEKDVRGFMLAQIQARKLYIETHQDVSILFADVVNYTFLTTKLDIKDLVETLHELFQRIDSACMEYNVTRIKFLGDCYYGVSGIPVSHPLHAVCCVELGRAIIYHIREIRTFRNLDIDMRIGIHSGSILAGIIGGSKWQYDIWSEDVNIANRLEATGAAGRIHVSRATLNLCHDFYSYENGPARAKLDNVLQKYFIYTYLIIDRNGNMDSSPEWLRYMQSKVGGNYVINQANVGGILQKDEALNKANKQMVKEVYKLPICKINLREHCFMHQRRLSPDEMEEFKAKRCVSAVFLQYEDWQWEVIHMNQPLSRFKLEASIGVFVLFFITIIQFFNIVIRNPLAFIIGNLIIILFGVIVTLIIWFDAIYRKIRYKNLKRSKFRPLRKIHKFIDASLKSTLGRIFVVSILLLLCLLAAWMPIMFCDYVSLENDDNLLGDFLKTGNRTDCFNSWAVTECVCLLIVLALSFTIIPYIYIIGVTIVVVVVYIYLICTYLSVIYETSIETNIGLRVEFSHIWVVLIIFYIYNLACRHFVYISKYNLYSRWQLNKKVENARVTNQSIEVLLHNILPSYVIQVYLARQMNNEPYYEKHRFVSVMFATIVHDDMERIDLRLMNEMICDFDDVLGYYKNLSKIEKIKVINWTYMAACGFDMLPEHIQSSESILQRFAFLPNKSRSNSQETTEEQRNSDISAARYRTSYQSNTFRLGHLNLYASDVNIENNGQARTTVGSIYNTEMESSNTHSDISGDSEKPRDNAKPLMPSESEDSEFENMENFNNRKFSVDISNKLDTDPEDPKYRFANTNNSRINLNNNEDENDNDNNRVDFYNNDNIESNDYKNYEEPQQELRFSEASSYPGDVDENVSRRKQSILSDKIRTFKPIKRNHNVFVCKALVHFALDLLRVVDSINMHLRDKMGTDFLPLKLRIGMSAGEVMAGIVGCRQAHYDIWGNSVNMASRMDTTGIPNEIQVTENVADILSKHGISCRHRGLTFVKGRGEIPTYFVNISEDREFQPK